MELYCIYKTYMDKDGEIDKVEIIEFDENEVNAQRFAKLYNLQVPKDMKHTIGYHHYRLRVS